MTPVLVTCLLLGTQHLDIPPGWHAERIRVATSPPRVRCTYADEHGLRHQFGDGPLFDVPPKWPVPERRGGVFDIRCTSAQPFQSAAKVKLHGALDTENDLRWLHHCTRYMIRGAR